MNHDNFAYEVYRQSQDSKLVDATTGRVFRAADMARATNMLYASGLRSGDFLVVASGVDPESALVYLGAIYGGLIPIPVADVDLDRYLPAIVAATDARFLWTKGQRALSESAPVSDLQVIRGFAIGNCGLNKSAATKPSDLAALMPTSGSTGVPKLVQVTHANLLANSLAIIKSQHLTGSDRALLILPTSYCFGASVLHTHLLVGGDVAFERRMMFPDKMLNSIDRFACTTLAGVPTVFKTLLRWPRFSSCPAGSLQKIFQAGGMLEPSAVQRVRDLFPNMQFFVMYGQTEATARISTLDPMDLDTHPGSVGKPLDELEIRIVNEAGSACRCGEAGEIWVRGPSVTTGYWRDSAATQRKFLDGWLKTGDVGSIDHDGFLSIAGRLDSFVKVRGLRLALGEVETMAQQLPEVQEAAACGITHDQFGEAVALFLVLSPDTSVTNAISRVRSTLPPQWAVEHVYAVDQLPKTTNNKINRMRLQEMAAREAA